MSFILCIESTSKNCSVAVVKEGRTVAIKERISENYTHAEELHPFIQECISDAGITATELSAVMVSSGPGSYTGLRIGIAAAKGMCFSLNIPLLAADTLSILALDTIQKCPGYERYMPMIDARRMEVYMGVWNEQGEAQSAIDAVVLEEEFFQSLDKKTLVFGDGAFKCKGLCEAEIKESIWPSADKMAILADRLFNQKTFEDLAYFEPFYLKDFQPGKPKKDPLVK